jgi:hypothetical protein
MTNLCPACGEHDLIEREAELVWPAMRFLIEVLRGRRLCVTPLTRPPAG